jgi:hypothetical protein
MGSNCSAIRPAKYWPLRCGGLVVLGYCEFFLAPQPLKQGTDRLYGKTQGIFSYATSEISLVGF